MYLEVVALTSVLLTRVAPCKQVSEQVNDVRKEELVGGPASGYETFQYHPSTIFQSVVAVFVVTMVTAALYFWCKKRGYCSTASPHHTENVRQVQYVTPRQEPSVRYEVVEQRSAEQPAQNVKAPALRVYN